MIYLSISDRIWVAIVPVPILTHPNVHARKGEILAACLNGKCRKVKVVGLVQSAESHEI